MVGARHMKITLNGQEKILVSTVTVRELLQTLGMAEKRVAVEVNLEIVPRSRQGEVWLQNNDCVEVVVAIGGG